MLFNSETADFRKLQSLQKKPIQIPIMLQVIQHQKSGELLVEELPTPTCKPGGILVRTAASLISAGTERTSVTNAQSSLIERVRKQPEAVKQVLDMVKKDGLATTFTKIQNKLDSYKTLGYSAAGIVVESRCNEFAAGDRVACAGAQYAHHAEYISVPKNLAVKLPDSVSFDEACYTTLGAIALQGVRQADVRLGETVMVIGLGLLGQLTVQLLKSSGCRVVGLDVNESLFERAYRYGCDLCVKSDMSSVATITAFARGIGADASIITASTSSNEPLELSLQALRKKGKVVIVGVTGMNLPRSPFYEKEIDIRISCSYGPGRYDPLYEEGGVDYPAGFVRWTENRNMQAFIDCIAAGTMDVRSMTTHRFAISEAQKGYDLVTGKNPEPSLGIVLTYPDRTGDNIRSVSYKQPSYPAGTVGVGLVGAGNFAQGSLLPPLQSNKAAMVSVSTSTPANAHSVAKRFGFATATTDSDAVITNKDVSLVVIASRHDSHGRYVAKALESGKAVFVEKPLCINREELAVIDRIIEKRPDARVMVGFNRRFSAPFADIKKFFASRHDPMSIHYRMNAGFIPGTNWIQDAAQGGRIIGEACHIIDCMVYLTGALPVRIYAEAIGTANTAAMNHDTVSISIKFSDGSIGTVHYYANGDGAMSKEYCEVFCEQKSAVMDNFKRVTTFAGKRMNERSYNGSKGHNEEIAAVVNALRSGTAMPIGYAELRAVTVATFAAEESLVSSMPVNLTAAPQHG
ncbi:MAG: bi-domain-containing oxidoreductase [Candidatus Kapabacteria bacterium]|nr:bi-domain-containing oxidoreductase [Candidatus Kapabacteria bacterium]